MVDGPLPIVVNNYGGVDYRPSFEFITFAFMQRSKKIFIGVSFLFFAGLVYLSYDISSRTTFPGSKPQLPERVKAQFLGKDSIAKDTVPSVQRPK